jgi:pimeloyl-ACP methyl ester carboxylesterase
MKISSLDKFQKLELQLQDKKVRYWQSGQGPTILFIHGFGISSIIWHRVYPYLINRYTVILLDLPGYGLNANLHITPKFDSLNKFICNFIEEKKLIDYLVGYSLGGVFSYRIAQHPPVSLKKIICVSSPIFYSRFSILLNWVFRVIGSHPIITKVVKFFVIRFPVKHLVFFLGGLASIINIKAMNDCMQKFSAEVNSSYIFNCASTIFSPTQFSSILIPMVLIFGEKDGFATPLMAKKAQSYSKNSHLCIVKDVFHILPLEKPQQLAHLIAKSCI